MSAIILMAYLLWFTLKVRIPAAEVLHLPKLKSLNIVLLILLFFQLIYGAFMAGTHAALSAPTWPDINGAYAPAGLLPNGKVWVDLYTNPITIQFIHRSLAYLIVVITMIWFFIAGKTPAGSWLSTFSRVPLLLVFAQITLGILAILNSMLTSAIYYSVIHQFIGMLLLTSFIITLFLSSKKRFLSID
jgi:cytochrome c oxidase assembly protein subunit 15